MTIKDLNVRGKRVLLRVDFNVPLTDGLEVADDSRVRAALPTIQYLLENDAKVILMSHLGRPDGNVVDSLSLRPVAELLEKLLERHVSFCPNIIGPVTQSAIECLKTGDCLLLENTRFYPEEQENDGQFSKALASLGDLFVNDAFGSVHRAHASTVGITKFFKNAACGFLIEKELLFLNEVLAKPEHPFCAIIGGGKVADKIEVISALLEKADDLLIGGAMAYSFLKAKGNQIGDSVYDDQSLEIVEKIFNLAQAKGKEIHLPCDHIVSRSFEDSAAEPISSVDIPENYIGMDIGEKTIENFRQVIQGAQTVLWNGPMGVFEKIPFQHGTFEIARAMAENGNTTIVGGGDSVAAVNMIDKAKEMSHVSTGGGASLEFLEGRTLPGIEALAER